MKVCIAGGGASGLMAAVISIRSGADVTIIEKNDFLGKKLKATGNGKCNITNTELVREDYYSDSPALLDDVLNRFSTGDLIEFMEKRGLLLKVMNGTGIYPYSEQSQAVIDVFLSEIKSSKVCLLTGTKIDRVSKFEKGLLVNFSKVGDVHFTKEAKGSSVFDKVILACGSNAGLGKRELGIFNTTRLLEESSIKNKAFYPALTGLFCDDKYVGFLSGIRAKGRASLYINNRFEKSFDGEIQFTDKGLSGILIFNLCRYAIDAVKGSDIKVYLDLLYPSSIGGADHPDPDAYYESLILSRRDCNTDINATDLFTGLVHKKIAVTALRLSHISPEKEAKLLSKDDIKKVLSFLRHLPFNVKGTFSVERSQVCRGGVPLSALTKDLEYKDIPGLYICGEMVDVDGPCGGYNLQWAFSSGAVCGGV